ncbi:MAG: hypothetical protein KGH63_02265 [Candidatus Micrarchaeota archaeon]|nr:hypothetical protein [Candidatus Micrarchaeota archaeon]
MKMGYRARIATVALIATTMFAQLKPADAFYSKQMPPESRRPVAARVESKSDVRSLARLETVPGARALEKGNAAPAYEYRSTAKTNAKGAGAQNQTSTTQAALASKISAESVSPNSGQDVSHIAASAWENSSERAAQSREVEAPAGRNIAASSFALDASSADGQPSRALASAMAEKTAQSQSQPYSRTAERASAQAQVQSAKADTSATRTALNQNANHEPSAPQKPANPGPVQAASEAILPERIKIAGPASAPLMRTWVRWVLRLACLRRINRLRPHRIMRRVMLERFRRMVLPSYYRVYSRVLSMNQAWARFRRDNMVRKLMKMVRLDLGWKAFRPRAPALKM